ncbi:hypothetical protein HanIR_Chr04g0151011 [Helianthus annuus]|nr:hypothetical protein HanIR_Chr04g0151011 [Helianthus annuus]
MFIYRSQVVLISYGVIIGVNSCCWPVSRWLFLVTHYLIRHPQKKKKKKKKNSDSCRDQ